MASKSWAIVEALAAQLATITLANGYLTDVGGNVWTSEGQRPQQDALGLMLYTADIAGSESERPGKPQREITLLIEAAITSDLDDAQPRIHAIIEDIEACMQAYALAQRNLPAPQQLPMHVSHIAVLDRPEGLAAVMAQVFVTARYFR